MTLAAVGDTSYDIVNVLHLLTAIVGAGALFAVPVFGVMMARSSDQSGADTYAALAAVSRTLIAPALLLSGVFGGALVGMSDDVWEFSQTWLAIAGPLWIVLVALVWFVVAPAQMAIARLTREIAAGGDRASLGSEIESMGARVGMATGLTHLGLVVMVYLMAFQPGI